MQLDPVQKAQEQQYALPYHYIPQWDDGFSQTLHWRRGYRYLGGISMVLGLLAKHRFHSLIDIGCGDGRFLREVRRSCPGVELQGVDYSQRAVALAQALNPGIAFAHADITAAPLSGTFDVATLVEVLEHIAPEDCGQFVAAVAEHIKPGGLLIATVPHVNKRVPAKHYRHFSAHSLKKALCPHFGIIDVYPFENIKSLLLKVVTQMIGGPGNRFVVTDADINRRFFSWYLKNYLKLPDESRCGRIAVVARLAA